MYIDVLNYVLYIITFCWQVIFDRELIDQVLIVTHLLCCDMFRHLGFLAAKW